MNLPDFHCYCPNTTDVNALVFTVGRMTVWYSYKTVVAFRVEYGRTVVRENEWGPTTGKHLNAIDDGAKGDRISGAEFVQKLFEAMKEIERASISG